MANPTGYGDYGMMWENRPKNKQGIVGGGILPLVTIGLSAKDRLTSGPYL